MTNRPRQSPKRWIVIIEHLHFPNPFASTSNLLSVLSSFFPRFLASSPIDLAITIHSRHPHMLAAQSFISVASRFIRVCNYWMNLPSPVLVEPPSSEEARSSRFPASSKLFFSFYGIAGVWFFSFFSHVGTSFRDGGFWSWCFFHRNARKPLKCCILLLHSKQVVSRTARSDPGPNHRKIFQALGYHLFSANPQLPVSLLIGIKLLSFAFTFRRPCFFLTLPLSPLSSGLLLVQVLAPISPLDVFFLLRPLLTSREQYSAPLNP